MILQIQGAIYSTLVNNAGVNALLARARDTQGNEYLTPAVYDRPPQPIDSADSSYFPFVTIGDISSGEWDTSDSNGFDSTVTIHVWSRSGGRVEVKTIQDAIYAALHKQDFTITGSNMIYCYQELANTMLDPDGYTYHGVQSFRVVSEQ